MEAAGMYNLRTKTITARFWHMHPREYARDYFAHRSITAFSAVLINKRTDASTT